MTQRFLSWRTGIVFFCMCVTLIRSTAIAGVQQPQIITIGALLPLSGSLSAIGRTNLEGMQFAAEHLNATQSQFQYKIIPADTKGDPAVGITQTRALAVHGGITAILGAYQSSVTYASSEVAEQLRIPYLVPAALADNITQRGFQYVFRTGSFVSRYAETQFKFLQATLGAQPRPPRVAILYEDTLFGQMAAIAQRKFASAYQYPIVADQAYSAQQLDPYATLSTLLLHKPQVLLLTAYLKDAIALAQALHKITPTPPIVFATGAGPKDPQFIPSTGVRAEKWLIVNEWGDEVGLPKAPQFNRKFQQRFGHVPDGIAVMNYTTMFVLHAALNKAHHQTADGIRDALASIAVTQEPISSLVPTGTISFDRRGQNHYVPFVTQILSGKHVAVWPPALAAHSPMLEVPHE